MIDILKAYSTLGWTFPIIGIISWVAYCINLLEEYGCIYPIYYINYLHPHIVPVPTCPPPPLPLNDAVAGEFEVEIFQIPVWVTMGPNFLSNGFAILFFKLCSNLLYIQLMPLVLFISFYLNKDGDLSVRGSDVKVNVLLNNFLINNIC